MEKQLNQVHGEQSKIINNFHELENRYKEIIRENQQIKNELLDLRKNRQVRTKVTPDSSFNLPLNKTTLNETVSARKELVEQEFFTPSKRETEKFSISKNVYEHNSGPLIFSSEKTKAPEDVYKGLGSLGNRREARVAPGFSYYG